MKIWELIAYSRRRIKGRRWAILLVCMLPLGAELVFRLAEAAFYSLLLYFGGMRPAALFNGESPEQLVLAAVFTILRWLVAAPLTCAAAAKLTDLTDEKPKGVSVTELLLSGSFIRRSTASYITGRLVCFAALVPSAAAGAYAFDVLSSGGGSRELFAATNSAAAAVVFAALWLAARLSITAVPYLLAVHPEKSGVRVVFMSLGFMRGRKRLPLMLGAVYLPLMLTVVGIPFFLPELAAAFTTGISIFMKEDEYCAVSAQPISRARS